MDLLHHLGKGKEEISPLQYHFKSLHIISRHYKKSLLRSQIYHGYEELSTDKNYPIWRRQERRSKYAVQLASWQLRSNSPKTSVRPSVRSLKYPLLTCTWVRWSTRPTVTVLRHVRPSVRLSVRPSGEVSGHLPENAWRDWPEILHADVSWPSSELISLWLWSVDFSNFGAILT